MGYLKVDYTRLALTKVDQAILDQTRLHSTGLD